MYGTVAVPLYATPLVAVAENVTEEQFNTETDAVVVSVLLFLQAIKKTAVKKTALNTNKSFCFIIFDFGSLKNPGIEFKKEALCFYPLPTL